ncbi:MAG: O-antigen ligase family protein [Planctomycetota bacterium]
MVKLQQILSSDINKKKIINILLFLYGISIGLPDIAIDFYNTRLRIDDGIMMIMFLCVFINGLYHPYRFTKSQLKFLKLIAIFAVFCLLSSCVTLILDLSFDSYSLLRMLGCMIILVTLSTILRSSRLLVWLGWGLLLGGNILILQVLFRWYSNAEQISLLAYSYRIKTALSFRTWNPNTSASYAIVFAFITALISYEMSGTKKGVFWVAAGVFSLIPLFTFSRAAAGGIGIAWLTFILFAHGNRPAKGWIVTVLFIGMVICIAIYGRELIRSTVRINLSTGEGLSDHHKMWRRALDLIARSPLIGHGFGQEIRLYKTEFGGGMAHNAFLSVCIEGGLVGLLLFTWPLAYLGRSFWRLTHGRFYDTRAVLCFGFLLGIIVLNLSQSALYWHKSQTLILSLMLVYIGTNERSQSTVAIAETTDAKIIRESQYV